MEMARPSGCSPLGYLIFLLLLHLPTLGSGALGAIRPAAPVLAVLGGEAGLTCHLSAPTDPEQVEVKWLRPQPPQVVHVFRDGQDQEGEQVPEYGGRTALEKGSLLEGNVTLRIRDLRLSDRGEYWCLVQVDSTNQQNATVELEVAGRFEVWSRWG
uniref:Ig-like domain-containing protein n=1 Tax=Ornithorhynchus anatinus TaxID=9258 RepID=A0A6I8PAV7_ORNAN